MITKQVYLWNLTPAAGAFNATTFPAAGEEFSIFTGGYGTNITHQPAVLEDHFIVIDDFGSTPGVFDGLTESGGVVTRWLPNGFVQIYIDTTAYYQNPEDIKSRGLSGDAAPFPKNIESQEGYLLHPDIYIRPFQTWDFRYTVCNTPPSSSSWSGTLTVAQVFVQYWLFTGSDALICEKLLKLGIEVSADNVEWFRRRLLISRGLDTSTWEWYLKTSQAYLEKEKASQENKIGDTIKL